MSGGGGSSKTTTTTQLDPVQRQALQSVINKSEQLYAQGPMRFFPGETHAGVTDATRAGWDSALGAVPGMEQFIGAGQGRIQDLISRDPETSQVTQDLANAVTAPLYDQFREQIAPNITSQAIQAGAFGGDRQHIANAIAGRETTRAAGEARANVVAQAARDQMQQQTALLGMMPDFAQASLLPSQVQLDIGAQQQEQQQAAIDAARERWDFEQWAPQAALDAFAARTSGVNLGGLSSSSTRGSGGGMFK